MNPLDKLYLKLGIDIVPKHSREKCLENVDNKGLTEVLTDLRSEKKPIELHKIKRPWDL